MTKTTTTANNKKGDEKSAATKYANILALRTLRWQFAKRIMMAPIARRMHADAKMLLALKEEMGEAAEGIWGDKSYDAQCTMQFEARGTFEDQLENLGEIESAGIDDIEASLDDIRDEVEKAAAAVGKVPDEPPTVEAFEKEHAEEAAALAAAEQKKREEAMMMAGNDEVIVIVAGDDE